MKNKIIQFIVIILFVIISADSFSQVQKELKTQIKPALLVIDIQNAYLSGMAQKEKETAMLNINYYIQLFRSHDCPIIRIYHYSKQWGPEQGTEQFEFPSSVLIKPDDPKVIKTYPDGFNKTELDKVLKEKGINTVFLCGLSSVGCVLATWIGAQNYDYKAFFIKDAIMSHNEEYTSNIETMFDAVSYDVISLVLENSGK
ncbi:MAG: isochorismatase family protein [Bacteroidales bacterium]|jgi:nicotinamidase-related amidase|nr:isochorismatase family protein [Bacteroidales bacterium]